MVGFAGVNEEAEENVNRAWREGEQNLSCIGHEGFGAFGNTGVEILNLKCLFI